MTLNAKALDAALEPPRRKWPDGHPEAYMKDHDHGAHRDGECPGCEREDRNRIRRKAIEDYVAALAAAPGEGDKP